MSYELRPYQEEAKNAILHEWENGHKKTLLILATGLGKTIVASKIIEEQTKKNRKVLMLAHRGELLLQAQDKLYQSTGLESSLEKAQYTTIGTNANIVIGSVQSMSGQRLEQFPIDYFDDIIIDEAHHCVSDTYQKVLNRFPNANILGITATPNRNDNKSLASYFDSVAYEYGMIDGIKDGYLSDIRVQRIPIELDISHVAINAGDYAPGELAASIEPYLEDIAEKMEHYCYGRKTLVFTPLVKTSQRFVEILNQHNFKAVEVNGNSSDRNEILDDFKNDKYDILVNSMLLTEGYDCPDIDCIIVLRPTQSDSLFRQMIGRGTRLSPKKSNLLLLDFLWLTGKHNLCHPAKLVAIDDEVANKMLYLINKSDEAIELLDCEKMAQVEIEHDIEEKLAKQLEEQKAKKSEFISSLQLFASLGELNRLREEPIYKWEKEPPTDKQIAFLNDKGIDTKEVTTKGLATKLVVLLIKRDKNGMSTIKQIKFLEKYGFKNVAKWSKDEAKIIIAIIVNNKWRVPSILNAPTFNPKDITYAQKQFINNRLKMTNTKSK